MVHIQPYCSGNVLVSVRKLSNITRHLSSHWIMSGTPCATLKSYSLHRSQLMTEVVQRTSSNLCRTIFGIAFISSQTTMLRSIVHNGSLIAAFKLFRFTLCCFWLLRVQDFLFGELDISFASISQLLASQSYLEVKSVCRWWGQDGVVLQSSWLQRFISQK